MTEEIDTKSGADPSPDQAASMPSPTPRRLKSLLARADIYRMGSGRFRIILQIQCTASSRYPEALRRGWTVHRLAVVRIVDSIRSWGCSIPVGICWIQGVHSPVSLPGNHSPKMLTRDSPTRHFQLNPATIPQIYFSAQKIDAPTSHESVQRFMDGPGAVILSKRQCEISYS